jgi:RecA-family ATPase
MALFCEGTMAKRDEPKFENLHDLLVAKARQDILNDWLKEGTVAVEYGRPGSFKTVIALALGNILSHGAEFNGQPAAPGLVVYLTC